MAGLQPDIFLSSSGVDLVRKRAADTTQVIALVLRMRWPPRSDWPGVVSLGVCYFGLFFILYNVAISYTTAARASLALSTLPLQTMAVGALLGIEPLSTRKTIGVLIVMSGVFPSGC